MKTIKNIPWVPITGGLGTLIIIALFGLICILDEPMAQFDSVIYKVYIAEPSLHNETEVLKAHPELTIVKQKMMQVKKMNLRKEDFFRSPAPIYSQGKAETITRYQEKINNRGGEISMMLNIFSTKIKLVTQNNE